MDEEEYYAYPFSGYAEHTAERPFCDDPTCPCHEDGANIAELEEYRQDGLVSVEDCDNIYHGRTF